MGKTTDQEIENALRSMSQIIAHHGEAYWPIFDRLENELKIRRSRAARLARYSDRQVQTSLESFLRRDTQI